MSSSKANLLLSSWPANQTVNCVSYKPHAQNGTTSFHSVPRCFLFTSPVHPALELSTSATIAFIALTHADSPPSTLHPCSVDSTFQVRINPTYLAVSNVIPSLASVPISTVSLLAFWFFLFTPTHSPSSSHSNLYQIGTLSCWKLGKKILKLPSFLHILSLPLWPLHDSALSYSERFISCQPLDWSQCSYNMGLFAFHQVYAFCLRTFHSSTHS